MSAVRRPHKSNSKERAKSENLKRPDKPESKLFIHVFPFLRPDIGIFPTFQTENRKTWKKTEGTPGPQHVHPVPLPHGIGFFYHFVVILTT
jgi:hypothetical protein